MLYTCIVVILVFQRHHTLARHSQFVGNSPVNLGELLAQPQTNCNRIFFCRNAFRRGVFKTYKKSSAPSGGEAGQISNQSDLFSLILLGLFGYQFYSFMYYDWIVENKISFNLMYHTCLYLDKQQRYDFSKCALNSKFFAFHTKLEWYFLYNLFILVHRA